MNGMLVADRLYALHCRPLEWDECRGRVRLSLRWQALAEDGPPLAEHAVLAVLEGRAELPDDHPLHAAHPAGLEVLRCGWEAVVRPERPLSAAALRLPAQPLAALAARMAAAINELAAYAGVEPLLTPADLATLELPEAPG